MTSEVTIPCHPLSRRVILAENGAEPVTLLKPDIFYDILAGYAINNVPTRNKAQFTATITLRLPARLAAHLAADPWGAAERLYRHDKEKLVWFAIAHTKALGSGVVRPSVVAFLDLFDVDEDDYSTDTAYKLYQRFGWEISDKNPHFSGQTKHKSARNLGRKKVRRAKFRPAPIGLTPQQVDRLVELAVDRFQDEYRQRYRRMPVKLPKQVRIYAYYTMQKITSRDLAVKLEIPRTTIQEAVLSIKAKMRRNPTLRAILAECTALPQVA